MDNEKVFCMRLAKIYDLLLNKAVRKAGHRKKSIPLSAG